MKIQFKIAVIAMIGIVASGTSQEKITTEAGGKSDFIYRNAKLEVYHNHMRNVQINPQNQLDVTGSASITVKEFVPSISLFDSSDYSSSSVIFTNDNSFFIGKNIGEKMTNSSLFNIGLNSGKVGIGTANPNAKLEVYHNHMRNVQINPQNQLDITGGASITVKEFVPSIALFDSSDHSSSSVIFTNDNSFFIGKNTGEKITNSSLFNIGLNSGKVGIGTANPNAKFEVYHNHMRNIQINPQNQLDVTGEASITVKEFVPSISLFDSSNDSSSSVIFTNDNSFFIGKNTGEKITNSRLFNIGLNSGNIGIGTINSVSWKLAVNGKVRAKEIKVETDWADFVFEESYKLPTLKEVENHIKEKGHLKDIPSAMEVEKNGIFLGEMNAKLLQKIEELTLYTISQEKKIKVLEKQVNDIKHLKEENKSLKRLNDKFLELQKRLDIIENKK